MDQDTSAKVKQYRVKLAKVTAIIERIKEGQQLDVKLSLEELITLQSELKQMLQIEAKKAQAPKEEEKQEIKNQEDKEEEKQVEKPEDQDIKMAAMRICCALYEAENKWYSAIVNGQNQKANTVEITWLGINEPSQLPYRHVELSKIPDPNELKPGIECECLFYDDGLWYPCLIVSQEKPVLSATGVQVNFYEVEFQNSSFKTRVPINFLRLQGQRAKAQAGEDSKKMLGKRSKPGDDEEQFEEEYTGDTDKFVIPQHLKLQAGDSQAQKEAKKRKKKALKWKFLQKQQQKVQTQRKSAWSEFLNKAGKNKKGYFSKQKGDSIFKSPDNIMGRVGVTGSGKGVTVTVMKKAKFQQIEEEQN